MLIPSKEEHLMADQSQVDMLLNQGVAVWNQWRMDNPDTDVDLGTADLSEAELSGANLSRARLILANLSGANVFH